MTLRRSITGLALCTTLLYIFAFLVFGHPYRTALQVYGGALAGWTVAKMQKRIVGR